MREVNAKPMSGRKMYVIDGGRAEETRSERVPRRRVRARHIVAGAILVGIGVAYATLLGVTELVRAWR